MPRPLRARIQTIQIAGDTDEKAASEPVTAQDEEGLASIAFLAGINPTNTGISNYLKTLNNAGYAAVLNAAAQ